MKQGLLQWRSPCHCTHFLSPLSIPSVSIHISRTKHGPIQQQLSARERRQLRNERREQKAGYSWREEVEERLIKKPKKRYTSKTEEMNLDTLADLGPRWWIVRVTRIRYEETAERLARSLARNFPDIDFKMYAPSVQVKKKLKNGSYSDKQKPIFPGCVFLRCVLNKERHDFIRECDGVGGFVGSKVGNRIKQINKPRPVSVDDMEAIFKEAKEAQEQADQAFEEEQQREGTIKSENLNVESNTVTTVVTESFRDSKPKSQSGKASAEGNKLPAPGSTVRVVSGTFAEFLGTLKKVNRKTRKATVGFTLFGKESLVDIDLSEIVPETN